MSANAAVATTVRPRVPNLYSCTRGTTLLHYLSGKLRIDLALQPRAETSCLEVSGTLADEHHGCLARVPAYLVAGTEIVDEAMTDRRGSFRLATRERDHLRLCLLLADDRFVELELRRGQRIAWAARPSPRSS